MTIDNPPVLNDPATGETRRNSRNVRSWILGILSGAILTVVLLTALIWLSTGLGLLRLVGTLHSGAGSHQR